MSQDQQQESQPELNIMRVFNAPRELVFRVWTEPEHLSKWCAPTGFTIPLSEGELRSGGAWRTRMVSPEGQAHVAFGEYREVVPVERLVFTHQWEEEDMPPHETLVTITFDELGERKTRMNFRQQFFRSVSSRDGHDGGWSQAFIRLGALLDELEASQA